jgi:hypothetical protein
VNGQNCAKNEQFEIYEKAEEDFPHSLRKVLFGFLAKFVIVRPDNLLKVAAQKGKPQQAMYPSSRSFPELVGIGDPGIGPFAVWEK